MCNQIKTLAKNNNGQLSICNECNVYHLTFNNIYFEFSPKEMRLFKKYVTDIEVEYWEAKYDGMPVKRKIPIQTQQTNLVMVFNRQELASLCDLITQSTAKPYDNLSLLEIDYTLYLN